MEHYGDNWFGVTTDGEYVLSDLEGYENTYKGKLYQAVGGGVWLMREHQLCPHRSEAVDPRTAVGITDDGEHSTILMGKAADGEMKILNSPSSGLSELRPVADILTLVKK